MQRCDGVREVALTVYPLPRKGVGIYAFVETDDPAASSALSTNAGTADLIQAVAALPRDESGKQRLDILHLIAMNQITELDKPTGKDKALAAIVAPIAAGRRNLADRRISRLEKPAG